MGWVPCRREWLSVEMQSRLAGGGRTTGSDVRATTAHLFSVRTFLSVYF